MRYSITGGTLEQVRSVGATGLKEAPKVGQIFAELNDNQVQRLISMGLQVKKIGKTSAAVMPPRPIEAFPTYSPYQFSVDLGYEDLRTITDPPLFGSGYNLAIIDTGIRETHDQINGQVVYSKNFTSDPMRDGFSHGTGVCSIAVIAAPECGILNLKVLDNSGEGTEEEAILAIDECIALRDEGSEFAPQVINLSLGTLDIGDYDSPIRAACRRAIAENIWVLAACGNSGPTPETIMSPACEKYVLAVGSVSYEPFSISPFSSRGPTREGLVKPDAVLFGQDLAIAGSGSDTEIVGKSGSSFSVALLSGMVVLLREAIDRTAVSGYPGYPEPAEAMGLSWDVLIDDYLPRVCAKPQGVPVGQSNDYGYGLPFGAFIRQVLVPVGIDLSTILSPMITLMFIGMMMKMVK